MSTRFNPFVLILLLQLSISCNEDSDGSNSSDPSNLQLEVVSESDGSGNISVLATGDNVDYFEFFPGDDSPEVVSETGEFDHTYQASGTYTITVKAYGTSGRFLQEEETVEVILEDDEIPQYEGYSLVWQDEFNGSGLSDTFWNYETGAGGWGNNELQFYRQENTNVSGGNLIITARKESFSGSEYTSSRLTTEDKYEFQYGRIDIRAKLPEGQGIWPALWMLGANFSSVSWPACGEIDIMEMVGGSDREKTVHGTLHWQDPEGDPNNGNHAEFGGSYTNSIAFSEEFHQFSIVWTETQIEWYVDDLNYFTQSITDPDKNEFQKPFFLIFNVAVGGNWPGNPDGSTAFPQQLLIDYVRVYQETE